MIRPLRLPSTSSLSSSRSMNASFPCAFVVFGIVMNILVIPPASPIVAVEPMRHARLGARGSGSSSAMADGQENLSDLRGINAGG